MKIVVGINDLSTKQLLHMAKDLKLGSTIAVAKSVYRHGKKVNKINYIARARVILKRAIRTKLKEV